MNALSLIADAVNMFSFKMEIQGTSSVPSKVCVNFDYANKSLSFPAILKDNQYVCTVEDLHLLFVEDKPETVNCSISVTINGKTFCPFRGMADLAYSSPNILPQKMDAAPTVPPVNVDIPEKEVATNAIPHQIKTEQKIQENKATVANSSKEKLVEQPKISILKTIESPQSKKPKIMAEGVNKSAKIKRDSVFEIKKTSVVYK